MWEKIRVRFKFIVESKDNFRAIRGKNFELVIVFVFKHYLRNILEIRREKPTWKWKKWAKRQKNKRSKKRKKNKLPH
jgi:hypothetical protein